ncbi:hypothetical protein GCM10023184_35110 [Flaviaesturariibacter amylovorans]|uniref:Uncharacterized protein n=1 Tax=Flaviaesturariibacter amylovorans TaxID=1084520 RepID=A0ABP8HFU6_9BACT
MLSNAKEAKDAEEFSDGPAFIRSFRYPLLVASRASRIRGTCAEALRLVPVILPGAGCEHDSKRKTGNKQ